MIPARKQARATQRPPSPRRVERRILTCILAVCVSAMVLLSAGCWAPNPANLPTVSSNHAISVAEAIAGMAVSATQQMYETEVEVFGCVHSLEAFFCDCFELSSGGQKVLIIFGHFPDPSRDDVRMEGIENGDSVLVRGTLRPMEELPPEIWAEEIIRLDRPESPEVASDRN